MAESAVILRPVSDISVTDGSGVDAYSDTLASYVYPEGSPKLYPLVNEEVADDDATYIVQTGRESATMDRIYTFGLDASHIPSNAKITAVNMYVRIRNSTSTGTNKGYFSISVNGVSYAGEQNNIDSVASPADGGINVSYSSSNTEYIVHSDALRSEGVDAINSFISTNEKQPTLQYIVRLYTKNTGSQGKTNTIQMTQCYVEVLYEVETGLNIHRKVSGVWLQAKAAYQKRGGAWVEITEDECKSVLKSSLCTK